jgi:hypothetical protein
LGGAAGILHVHRGRLLMRQSVADPDPAFALK